MLRFLIKSGGDTNVTVCIEEIKLRLIFQISQCALNFRFHSTREKNYFFLKIFNRA